MIPKIIKSEEDYNIALNRIEEIFDAKPGTPEFDEMELLVRLVEIYEDEKYPISAPDPISAIKFRMEQQGLKSKDLIPYIGSKSKVSEVLSGKRALSLDERVLGKQFIIFLVRNKVVMNIFDLVFPSSPCGHAHGKAERWIFVKQSRYQRSLAGA